MNFAVVSTGGHQYKVQPNDTLLVNRLPLKIGEKFELDDLVKGGKVQVEVIEHIKSPKIKIFKFKPKTRYQRTTGFRGQMTKIKVLKIT